MFRFTTIAAVAVLFFAFSGSQANAQHYYGGHGGHGHYGHYGHYGQQQFQRTVVNYYPIQGCAPYAPIYQQAYRPNVSIGFNSFPNYGYDRNFYGRPSYGYGSAGNYGNRGGMSFGIRF